MNTSAQATAPLRSVPTTAGDTHAQIPSGRLATLRGPDALCAALAILADQMSEAVARRRAAAPATESFRRADAQVAYIAELFRQLQRQMVIPEEVWRLGAPVSRLKGSTASGRRCTATSQGVLI